MPTLKTDIAFIVAIIPTLILIGIAGSVTSSTVLQILSCVLFAILWIGALYLFVRQHPPTNTSLFDMTIEFLRPKPIPLPDLKSDKPQPPPPKSKRLGSSERRSRQVSRRFGPALVVGGVFFCTPLGPVLFGAYFIIVIPLLMIVTSIGTAMWNSQEWVQQSWREEEQEQQQKWDEEDRQWAAYEAALKKWDAKHNPIPPPKVSDEVRQLADELRRERKQIHD